VAIGTIKLREYRLRLRRSERLRYRTARFLLWAIPLSLLILLLAYTVATRG
jgi:hypothetical protein